MWRAPPAATLIEENDAVAIRVEVPAARVGAPGSRVPVNDQRRLPVRVAAGFPVDKVVVADLEHSVGVGLD